MRARRKKSGADSWRRLDPAKIRTGAELVAKALGTSVVRLEGLPATEEAIRRALAPWCGFAHLTLLAGAFGYPKNAAPSNGDVVNVTIDFLRAAGYANAEAEIRLRTALAGPLTDDMRAMLKLPAGT